MSININHKKQIDPVKYLDLFSHLSNIDFSKECIFTTDQEGQLTREANDIFTNITLSKDEQEKRAVQASEKLAVIFSQAIYFLFNRDNQNFLKQYSISKYSIVKNLEKLNQNMLKKVNNKLARRIFQKNMAVAIQAVRPNVINHQVQCSAFECKHEELFLELAKPGCLNNLLIDRNLERFTKGIDIDLPTKREKILEQDDIALALTRVIKNNLGYIKSRFSPKQIETIRENLEELRCKFLRTEKNPKRVGFINAHFQEIDALLSSRTRSQFVQNRFSRNFAGFKKRMDILRQPSAPIQIIEARKRFAPVMQNPQFVQQRQLLAPVMQNPQVVQQIQPFAPLMEAPQFVQQRQFFAPVKQNPQFVQLQVRLKDNNLNTIRKVHECYCVCNLCRAPEKIKNAVVYIVKTPIVKTYNFAKGTINYTINIGKCIFNSIFQGSNPTNSLTSAVVTGIVSGGVTAGAFYYLGCC